MALTDTSIRNVRPKEKSYRLYDANGLYLEVTAAGSKYFRYKYRFKGKEKRLALGVYPEVSLKKAREKTNDARALLRNDVDPGEYKKTAKRAEDKDSFEHVAREWYTKHKLKWVEAHSARILSRLEKDIFPWLGRRPINEINAPELLSVLRRIESRGALETSHRVMQICGRVFRYAVATGRCERDPSGDLKGALQPALQKHHASITDPKKIGELLRAIDGYQGYFVSKCAMRLAPLVFVRPGELRHAEWTEIDLQQSEWRIPAEKMKMRITHITPLSHQAVRILEELKPLTGDGRYVFPSVRTNARPISENTVLSGLRRLGYDKNEMTGHGFRSMASTILNEQGWNRDAIERQLAHAERDAVRAAYNYAEHLPERRKMMQAWADYLDGLKQGADVVPIHKKA